MTRLGQTLAAFAILGCLASIAEGGHWSYRDLDMWTDGHYPKCSLKRQSPININTSTIEADKKLTEFQFTGYASKSGIGELVNNGHTVQLNVEEGMSISGADLNGEYNLLQLHFHWCNNDSQGSEHTVNDGAYPLEMHLVHQKADIGTIDDAKNADDGLAVLGVLFEIGEENAAYNPLLEGFQEVKYKDGNATVYNVSIADLLPANVMSYFRYLGSLTTPTCDEAVIWTLFTHTVEISPDQMVKFRALQAGEPGSNEGTVAPNYRPTQMLYGRVVKRTADHDHDHDDNDPSSGSFVQPTIATIISVVSFIVSMKQ